MGDDISRERVERVLVWMFILGGILSLLLYIVHAVQPYFLGLLEKSHESAAFFVVKIMTSVLLILFGLYIWISKKIQQRKEVAKVLKEAVDMRGQYKAELAAKDAENEKLRARVAELENAPREDPNAEEIDGLIDQLEKMEAGRDTLSRELEAKVLELARLRQELENLKAVHGEGPKLRTMWRYVLELEARGKTDVDIRNALQGDGFHNPAIDALLYNGDGETFSAVSKASTRAKK